MFSLSPKSERASINNEAFLWKTVFVPNKNAEK